MLRFTSITVLAWTLASGCSLYYDRPHTEPGDPGASLPDAGAPDGNDPFPDAAIGSGAPLVEVKAIAGEHTVAGVDSDRAGGIWIVYRDQDGGYYTNADVWVTHLDPTGAKLSEWYYNDDYTQIAGIAYDGTSLWVNYNNEGGTGNYHLRQLDPATGATIGTFATISGLMDITANGHGELYLSYLWSQIIAIDSTTGAIDSRTANPAIPDAGIQHGIAYDSSNGALWISAAYSNQILQVTPDGALAGTWTAPVLDDSLQTEAPGLELAWDGTHVLLVHDNEIIWLQPE